VTTSLQTRLESLVDRHEELSALLSDPDVIADQKQFVSYSQEYSELDPIVSLVQRARAVDVDLEELESYCKGSDPDLRDLAEAEIPELRQTQAQLQAD
jgi:Protein chain release factor A